MPGTSFSLEKHRLPVEFCVPATDQETKTDLAFSVFRFKILKYKI